jgi:hypothetical protein
MVVSKGASVSAHVGALVKSVGQPCAGKPHARLEEGAPIGLSHARILRHRQPKGAATAMASLQPSSIGPYSTAQRRAT